MCIRDRLVEKISREIKEIEGVEIILRPGMEHRFVLILRGEGLKEGVRDTDPQKEGLPPYEPQALDAEAEKTARVLKLFLEKAHQIIKDEPKANTILMRGFSPVSYTHLDVYKRQPLEQSLLPATVHF